MRAVRRLSTRVAMKMASKAGVHQLCLTKSADEIRSGLKVLTKTYEERISALMSASSSGSSGSTFRQTFGQLADADGFAALASVELTLPALVSGDPEARAASADAKKSLSAMWSKTYTRPDLYNILNAAKDAARTPEEIRLAKVVLEKFRQSGCALEPKERDELASLDRRCKDLAFQARAKAHVLSHCSRVFTRHAKAEQNINEDCSVVDLTPVELAGCEESFIRSLPDVGGSKLLKRCSLKAPVLGCILT